MKRLIEGAIANRLVVAIGVALAVLAGLATAPFDWHFESLPRDPVPVDAIPDISESQQIVFTGWPGSSPQDVEDQVTYPLTVALLGIPGVKTVRSTSMFGASMINVLMEDGVDFYWSRSRVLEKLSSLPPDLLPPRVRPALGPDATALGQVYWYTLEGRDPAGNPTPGWSQSELRSIQDFLIKPALNSAAGISEVASVGGYVKEYQIDVDPAALRAYGIPLEKVLHAVRSSNRDVGAQTLEVNRIEYVIRGIGTIRSIEDLQAIVVTAVDQVPVRLTDLARVHLGPAPRRGALDKDGAAAVGGVAVVRFGANPMLAIQALKQKIVELQPGLPTRTLADGTVSKLTIVPFYDRTELIQETLGTLENALTDEILITILVVLVMVLHVRASLLIASLLPIAVLMTFVAMKVTGVDANIVALSGIAIAIGTMVDMGIVVTENILKHIEAAPPDEPRATTVSRATGEVAGAVLTAVGTTVVGFLPVFGLQAAEGKLFTPLAWTKTFALGSAVLIALVVLPSLAVVIFGRVRRAAPPSERTQRAILYPLIAIVAVVLAAHWMPLGYEWSVWSNIVFVMLLVGGLLTGLKLFQEVYPRLLELALANKGAFLVLPGTLVFVALTIWFGASSTLGWLPDRLTSGARARMPGLEGEFMPALDEGSFLYMPSAMPHASIGATLEAMQSIDAAIAALPEVEHCVGKLGRAESALDPAPIGMIEAVVTLKPEWSVGPDGARKRNWRPHIRNRDDIWNEIVAAGQTPELSSAPVLQPIETRIVMLQTGMRAAMGIKVRGPDLATIEAFGLRLQRVLEGVEETAPGSVLADRVIGKPYLEIHPDREAIARHGLQVENVQRVLEVAVGGKPITRSVEGRESYAIRVRYPPELRLTPEDIGNMLVATNHGTQVPLKELANIKYARGPRMIRSEDTFKTVYVTFGPRRTTPMTEVVAAAERAINAEVASGALVVPPGVTWRFAGTWESKLRSDRRLRVLVPVALLIIFVLLYLQFRSVATTLMVYSGVAVAMSGGFIMIWLWGQTWFLNFSLLGIDPREMLQVNTINLSVAVWVGFIALIGIATDDGVVMATYLDQRFAKAPPRTLAEINAAVIESGRRRIRPCLMTTATTVLGLLPVLTNHGRGADIMIPMAIPAFGGMTLELITLFVVPVLYAGWQSMRMRLRT